MRLTQDLRVAICAAIMDRVDKSEIERLRSTVAERALESAMKRFPALIQTAWSDAEARHFIQSREVTVVDVFVGDPLTDDSDRVRRYSRYESISIEVPYSHHTLYGELQEELKCLFAVEIAAFEEAVQTISTLRHRVRGALAGIQTVKQLKERYPEWYKFLPENLTQTINKSTALVDANLMTDLMQAGWPDGKRPETVEAVEAEAEAA